MLTKTELAYNRVLTQVNTLILVTIIIGPLPQDAVDAFAQRWGIKAVKEVSSALEAGIPDALQVVAELGAQADALRRKLDLTHSGLPNDAERLAARLARESKNKLLLKETGKKTAETNHGGRLPGKPNFTNSTALVNEVEPARDSLDDDTHTGLR